MNQYIVSAQILNRVVIHMAVKRNLNVISCFFCVLMWSCQNMNDERPDMIINVNEYQYQSFDWVSLFGKDLHYVTLDTDSSNYNISYIDKIVIRNDKFYINDWKTRRLLIFDIQGHPLGVINRRGRGPEEYLQITDFDVDDNGSLWLLDGQKDIVSHYSEDGGFLSSRGTGGYQYSHIAFRRDSLFLGLANWDEDNSKVFVADTNLNINLRYYVRPVSDPDFGFSGVGFTDVRGKMFYNQPIDDDVVEFGDAEHRHLYHFDFGSRRVPDEVRKSIEPNFKDIHNYSFLMNVVGVFDNVIVGSMCENTDIDFLMDMDSKIMYKQNRNVEGLVLKGISDNKVLFLCKSEDCDKDVIAYISLDKLKTI